MKKSFLILLLGSLLTGCQALEETTNIMDYDKVEEIKEIQEVKKTISLDGDIKYIIDTVISNHNSFETDNIIVSLDETLKEKTNEIGYRVVIDLNNNYGFQFHYEEKIEELIKEVTNTLLDKLYYDYGNEYSYYTYVNIENIEVAMGTYNNIDKDVLLINDKLLSNYISYDIK